MGNQHNGYGAQLTYAAASHPNMSPLGMPECPVPLVCEFETPEIYFGIDL